MSDAENSARSAPRVVGRPFERGRSGNPGGRPKAVVNVQELARQHTEQAVRTLVEALRDPRHRVAAAQALLDRGWGRPALMVTGDQKKPLVVDFKWADSAPVSTVVQSPVIDSAAVDTDGITWAPEAAD